MKESLAERGKDKKAQANAEQQLQARLAIHEAGAVLDTTTPADDHCLFHALSTGRRRLFYTPPQGKRAPSKETCNKVLLVQGALQGALFQTVAYRMGVSSEVD